MAVSIFLKTYKAHWHFILLIIITLGVMDLVLTCVLINNNGISELNPMVNTLISYGISYFVLVKTAIITAFSLVFLLHKKNKLTFYVTFFVLLLYLFVVVCQCFILAFL